MSFVRTELPDPHPLHQIFEAQAAAHPDRIALDLDGETLSFRELDERANDVAHALRDHGVGPESIVGVAMERSLEMVIALYAVHKAGGAYAPLDPELPAERLAFMARDLDARVILLRKDAKATFDTGASALVKVDAGAPVTRPTKPSDATTDTQLAYVIYTSGSTGTPKAAMNVHGGLRNRILWMQDAYPLGEDDRVLQKTPFSFDVSVWEFFWPLAFGARLVIARPDGHKDPGYLSELIRSARITTLHFVPSMLQMFLEDPSIGGCTSLKRVICSGEALPRALVERFHARLGAELHNLYGPTEASVDVTHWHCQRGEVGEVPIGRPIWNTQIHVMDEAGKPCPSGVAGELWLGGDGVGRGYWRRPELTAEKFVSDPLSADPGRRVYRSGDLGRMRADGAFEYLGRIDHQVKIRGQRIELGEIEATIARDPAVREAVVVMRDAGEGDQRLVGYLVAKDGAQIAIDALRSQLGRTLAEYMVPSELVVLDALPLTSSGKVDRKALPAPTFHAARAEYVAPRTPTETTIAAAFAQVLRVEQIGVHDDFFALGGHSLLAMQLAARLKRELGVALPVRAVFKERTVEALARHAEVGASGACTPEAPLVRASRDNRRLPLSRLQERLWFLEKLEPSSTAYLLTTATRLRGELRVDVLERACAELVRRHESFRTTFEEKGDKVVQVLHEALPLRWERRDLSRIPAAERARAAMEQVRRESTTAFDLRKGPLLRVKLLKLEEQEHILLFTMHHIISDGWSLGIIASELESLYRAFCAHEPSPLTELAVQYADYAVWERLTTTDADVATQLAHWKTHLAGAPAALELPTDRPRPPVQKYRGAHVIGRVSPRTTERLHKLARRSGASMYMTLLAAFTALLDRLTGQHDIVVATPIVNRTRPETEAMVGFFMNTLALRVDTGGNPTFEELLVRARETSLAGFANQLVPFDRVVQELNPARDMSRSPLAQVSLNLLNLPDMRVRIPGVEAEPIVGTGGGSKFDFTLYVDERDGLALELVYDTDIFDQARMVRLLRRFELIVEHMAAAPTKRIADVSLVLEDEKSVLPDPTAPIARAEYRSIASRFDAHAKSTPGALAVRDPRRSWTYGELESRANQVANWLAHRGIGHGQVVAVYAERNALTVCALLAVMKSGAAFVLLAADYPTARLAEQVRISKPSAWLDATDTASRPGDLDAVMPPGDNVVALADDRAAWASQPKTTPAAVVAPDARAYVVFTSGTSGGPKGIAGSHAPLAHFVEWHEKTHSLGPADRFSAFSGLSHDPFLRDVLTPLAVGATICVPPTELMLEPDALASWIAKEGVTVSHVTPSLGEVLSLSRGPALPALRLVCFAGEPLRGELVQTLRKVARSATFVNFYGATETPQAMGYEPVPDGMVGVCPVGRGIEGVQLLVSSASGGLAGVDEEGEISIRTPYLALGYVDGEARGFGVNAFTSDPDDRVYRTGDRGRFLVDGSVQLLGRIDEQVKVRGFRVELAEVVDALRTLPGVRQAAVILDEARRVLVGYAVGEYEPADATAALRQRLPAYMVPSHIVKLDAIPLTPNGKVDRRALPAPEARSTDTSAADGDDDVVSAITDIWKLVLDLETIDIRDNFFDLGGHSLLATQLAVRLREAFNVEISVRTIFEAPTIAELSEKVIAIVLTSAPAESLTAALEGLDS